MEANKGSGWRWRRRWGGERDERLPGVSEGEEDGSTSAPPAEELNRGSAFCLGDKKKNRKTSSAASRVTR